uniref:BZIP domain-containing protein n=1 Tax=Brassica campestris TaxID=3711 RepID=M4EC18_BRACM
MMQRVLKFLGSLTMNPRHNEIAPLNTSSANSPRFPSPRTNGGGESGPRGGMPRPRGRILPPLLPYPQIPPTRPPMRLPTYGPSSRPVFSFGSQPPMTPAPSWLPPYYLPAPVANYNAALPPRPFTRPTTSVYSGGSLPPRNGHRRRNRYNVPSSSSQRPRSADRMIYPRPIEMPFGVMMPNEAGNVMNVLLTDYMDPDKIFYDYNEDDLVIIFGDSDNVKSSGSENRSEDTSGVTSVSMNSNLDCNESPKLPPSPGNLQGVTNSANRNENAFEIDKGAGHSHEIAPSDPNRAKRVLANRESSARSNAMKVHAARSRVGRKKIFICAVRRAQPSQVSCKRIAGAVVTW